MTKSRLVCIERIKNNYSSLSVLLYAEDEIDFLLVVPISLSTIPLEPAGR